VFTHRYVAVVPKGRRAHTSPTGCRSLGLVSLYVGGRLKVCTGCERAYYCSPECQKLDWTAHKKRCRALRALSGKVGSGGAKALEHLSSSLSESGGPALVGSAELPVLSSSVNGNGVLGASHEEALLPPEGPKSQPAAVDAN
jgi:hypothetical protein